MSRVGGFAGATRASACRSVSLGLALGAGVGLAARAATGSVVAAADHGTLIPGSVHRLAATPNRTAKTSSPRATVSPQPAGPCRRPAPPPPTAPQRPTRPT